MIDALDIPEDAAIALEQFLKTCRRHFEAEDHCQNQIAAGMTDFGIAFLLRNISGHYSMFCGNSSQYDAAAKLVGQGFTPEEIEMAAKNFTGN